MRAPCTSSPWSFTDWLYFLGLRHVGWRFNNPCPDCSEQAEDRWSVDRSASNVRATGVWVCLIWRATGLLKDLHTWADPWRGTQCGNERQVGPFLASSQTQRLKVDVGRWAKHFVREFRTALRNLLGSSDLSRPRKELYRELVVGSASAPLGERWGWKAEEIRAHWAPESGFLNNSEFSIAWWLARNALPLLCLNFRAGLVDMPDCPRCGSGFEDTAEHVFYYCERVRPFCDHVGECTAREYYMINHAKLWVVI